MLSIFRSVQLNHGAVGASARRNWKSGKGGGAASLVVHDVYVNVRYVTNDGYVLSICGGFSAPIMNHVPVL